MKPKKILEVGVSSGGSAALILNAIKDIDGAHLYSVDYCENAYRYPDKQSGFLVDEKFPELKNKWTIYRGGDVSKFIEEIGGDIDLVLIDTMHIHPWESLNFLCVLPFMKRNNNSWVILHDIAAHFFAANFLACRYLWSHAVSDEKLSPAPETEDNSNYKRKYGRNIPHFANIGAFKITDDTFKYIGNVFEALLNPWISLPVDTVPESQIHKLPCVIWPEDLNSIKKILAKYYPEYITFFDHVLDFQKIMYANSLNRKPKGFIPALKNFMWDAFPKTSSAIRAIKHIFKHK